MNTIKINDQKLIKLMSDIIEGKTNTIKMLVYHLKTVGNKNIEEHIKYRLWALNLERAIWRKKLQFKTKKMASNKDQLTLDV